MFGFRSKNRRKRPFKERLRAIWKRMVDLGRKALPVVVLLAVAIAIPYGIFQAYIRTVSGPYFELDEIEVRGLEHVDEDALLETAGLYEGLNVFDIDLERAEAAVESLAWVDRAEFDRRLPDRVAITIEEYRPEAVLVDSGYQLVDDEGRAFKQLEPSDSVDALVDRPLITGMSVEDLDDSEGRDRFFDAVKAAETYDEMGLSDWEALSEVHVDAVVGLTLITEESSIEVRLGRGRIRERLERLEQVQESIVQRSMEVDYILIDRESDLSRVAVGRHRQPGTAEVEGAEQVGEH